MRKLPIQLDAPPNQSIFGFKTLDEEETYDSINSLMISESDEYKYQEVILSNFDGGINSPNLYQGL